MWAALGAIGVGGGFPLGLSVIAWRASDGGEAGAVSGMAMGFGYLLAGAAPPVMGVLLDATSGYSLPLGVLLAAGAVQATVILAIGDGPRRRAPTPSPNFGDHGGVICRLTSEGRPLRANECRH